VSDSHRILVGTSPPSLSGATAAWTRRMEFWRPTRIEFVLESCGDSVRPSIDPRCLRNHRAVWREEDQNGQRRL